MATHVKRQQALARYQGAGRVGVLGLGERRPGMDESGYRYATVIADAGRTGEPATAARPSAPAFTSVQRALPSSSGSMSMISVFDLEVGLRYSQAACESWPIGEGHMEIRPCW